MARAFVANDTNNIQTTTMPTTATSNVTIGCWVKYTNLTTYHDYLFSNGAIGSSGYAVLYHNTAGGGNNTLRAIYNGVALGTGAAISSGSWMHVALVIDGSNDALLYVNGAQIGSTLASNPNTPASRFTIGDAATAGNNLPKSVAELFVCTRILTAAELTLLALGMSPKFLNAKPVLHWPLMGKYSPEIDIIGANGGTLGGTTTPTAADHPRIFNPFAMPTPYHVSSGNRRRRSIICGVAA